jgi:DNA-directed RNA polymerase specialized sigma24 family protein
MANSKTENVRLVQALGAAGNLWAKRFTDMRSSSTMVALDAYGEIEHAPQETKCSIFYKHFFPLLREPVDLLADMYRRCLKVALAHPRDAGPNPHDWAWCQVQFALNLTFEWIRDWYILACDGENQHVRHLAAIECVPGQTISVSVPTTAPPTEPPQSWCAPAWLFRVYPVVGMALIRSEHVPSWESEKRLGAAHTRLLLKWARRMLLGLLREAIQTVHDEEIAAAGALPAEKAGERTEESVKTPKHWLKGFEGLRKQRDLSQYDQYMDGLTEKQRMALSLRLEYGCRPAEIAIRMGISRKTAWEHLQAAQAKIDQLRSNDKHAQRSKRGSE